MPTAREAVRSRAQTARSNGLAAVVEGLLDHWFLPQTVRQRPDLVARAARTVLRHDPSVHAAMWEMIADTDLLDQLPGIEQPTLILVGEHDSTSPIAAARQKHEALRDSRLRVIPHAAHLSPLERPELITRHLDDFTAMIA